MITTLDDLNEEWFDLAHLPFPLGSLGFENRPLPWGPDARMHCVWIRRESSEDHLLAQYGEGSCAMPGLGFREWLPLWKPTNLLECVAALDIHALRCSNSARSAPPSDTADLVADFPTDLQHAISLVLQWSRGHLIWHFQFEALVGFYYHDPVRVRKEVFARRVPAMQSLEQMEIRPGLTLKQLLARLMPFEFTRQLNMRGGRLLWRYLSR